MSEDQVLFACTEDYNKFQDFCEIKSHEAVIICDVCDVEIEEHPNTKRKCVSCDTKFDQCQLCTKVYTVLNECPDGYGCKSNHQWYEMMIDGQSIRFTKHEGILDKTKP